MYAVIEASDGLLLGDAVEEEASVGGDVEDSH